MGERTRTCAVIIHIQFAATEDRFSIRVRESAFKVDMPNAVRFNADGLLAGFGEDEPQAGWTQKPILRPPPFRTETPRRRDLSLHEARLKVHEERLVGAVR